MKRGWLLLIVITLVATACGAPAPVSPGADESPLARPTSPISPPPTPSFQRETTASIAEALRPQVAEAARIDVEALALVSEEQVTWRDASLGCPQPGMSYAQVLVPGWRIVFADGTGQEYEVHAAENPDTYVICGQPVEEQPKPTPPLEAQGNPAVEAAKKLVADQLELQIDAVSVVEAESVEWRDSCLGCAAPGQMCLMVITPGYRVELRAGDVTYQVHTDRAGQRAIFCDAPAPALRTDK